MFFFYHNGTQTVFYGAQNGKREIFMDIIGPVGTYTLTLTGTTVTNGRFDGTLNPSRMSMTGNRFLDDVVPGSIIDQATAHYNIAPNSYVGEVNWTDINGINRTITGQGNIGELWLGSSVGHSFDGRRIVDLSAPGDLVITSYSPTSYWATATHNLVTGGNGLYGRAGAVSAAAPQVVGVVALMLERNPLLDAVQIKRILQISSRPDIFTGMTPNPEWGYGKMDAYRAVELAVNASITGQARNMDGMPLRQMMVTLTDGNGNIRRSITNAFGYYRFEGLTLGSSYTLSGKSRSEQIDPMELRVTGMMTDVDLVPTVTFHDKGPDKAAKTRR